MKHNAIDSSILVTGAAGRIGSVGRRVTEMLLADGIAVRAQVRSDDERAATLRAQGAEVVVGDLLDIEFVHRAFAGCQHVFFGMSVSATYLEAAANVAAAAKHHAVQAFVNLSQMTVSEMDIEHTTNSPQQRQHWLVEQILSWSGLPVVEVRPTSFMESLFLQNARSIAAEGKMFASFGSGKSSPIAAEDVARTVAHILANPNDHAARVYELTGPISQDMPATAAEISAALGRPVQYVDVPLQAWKARLASFGMDEHVSAHVATMAELQRANRYDRLTHDVEQLTGTPPMSVGDFVKKNARAFGGAGT